MTVPRTLDDSFVIVIVQEGVSILLSCLPDPGLAKQ